MSLVRPARTPGIRFIAGGALALLTSFHAVSVNAQTVHSVPIGAQTDVVATQTKQTFTLADCLALARDRQPRLAVQLNSLAAAEDGCRALEGMKLAGLVDHEIPIRRRQAALGVAAAHAGVEQAIAETDYAVMRTYATVLYAREQERVARSIVDRLTAVYESAEKQLNAGARDVSSNDVARAKSYLQLAKTKQIQAAQGVKRAVAALREAISLPCDVTFEVAAGAFPEPRGKLVKHEVIELAIARRPELVRAVLFAEIVCLEVEAQGTCFHPKMETFAAAADIHSSNIPQGIQNGEYRPGATPPEMPTMLVGSRAERMKRAQSLYARALSVADVARNLITLEAEDAFLRWEEATLQIAEAKIAAETADQLADDFSKDFSAGAKVRVEDVVNARVLASQARASYNEFLYKQYLALADIERITSGAIPSGLVAAPKSGQPK